MSDGASVKRWHLLWSTGSYKHTSFTCTTMRICWTMLLLTALKILKNVAYSCFLNGIAVFKSHSSAFLLDHLIPIYTFLYFVSHVANTMSGCRILLYHWNKIISKSPQNERDTGLALVSKSSNDCHTTQRNENYIMRLNSLWKKNRILFYEITDGQYNPSSVSSFLSSRKNGTVRSPTHAIFKDIFPE